MRRTHGNHDAMAYDGHNADLSHLCQICGEPMPDLVDENLRSAVVSGRDTIQMLVDLQPDAQLATLTDTVLDKMIWDLSVIVSTLQVERSRRGSTPVDFG